MKALIKVWYVQIGDQIEGPYSFQDLKQHKKITPDTLACREGTSVWKPIKKIPELKDLFKDDEEKEEERSHTMPPSEILVKDSRLPGPFFDILVMIILILLLWAIFQVFR